jgi:D-alanine--poly(phosphoribitol) ligase subunit 1
MECERLIVDYFESTAVDNDNPAIRWGKGQCLSWKVLYEKAHGVAQSLITEHGLRQGECVAVGLERSPEYLISSYAVLLAGGIYFPVDVKTPVARMASMLATAKCHLALCGSGHQSLFQQAHPQMKLIGYELLRGLYRFDRPGRTVNTTPRLRARDPAYLLFTSGTTGEPKGVLVSHGAFINRLRWHQAHGDIEDSDIILQRTALTFDVSLWELFLPALSGASNYLLQPGWESMPRGIVASLQNENITLAHFVPSLLKPVLQELESGDSTSPPVPALRRVYVSGESLTGSLVDQFHAVFSGRCKLTNLYGPTEAAIDVSYYDCVQTGRATIPIGRSIAGCHLYIVNPDDLALRAHGEKGEIAIGGVCLAEGYYSRQDLTDKAFVFHPEIQERIYLTGDLGWYEEDGLFFCEGRRDTQVKLRGLRIELGEIEHHLLRHPGITEAVVCVVDDPSQQQWLVAAVAPGAGGLDTQDIRRFLAAQLPTYMLPARFWQTWRLPRSSSGKLDRKLIASTVRDLLFGDEERAELPAAH